MGSHAPSSCAGSGARPWKVSIEYSFSHAIIRDVSYAQIPRAQRAERHIRAASWIEAVSRDRVEDHAEILAAHYFTALELAAAIRYADTSKVESGASRAHDLVDHARGRATHWLLVAAQRALLIDGAGSLALYERALALEPEDPTVHAEALVGSARAGRRSGKIDSMEVLRRLDSALEIERRLDDQLATAGVLTRLASQLGATGQTAKARIAIREAVELLERLPQSHELATAYAYRAEMALFAGRPEDAMLDAERTLTVLGEDSSDSMAVMALHIRGDARCSRGDRGGLDDLLRALDLSTRTQSVDDTILSEAYLADWLLAYEGPLVALPHLETSIELADRRGVVSSGGYAKAQSLLVLYELGDWEAVLARAEELLAVGHERLDTEIWLVAQLHRTKVLVGRGLTADLPKREELLAETQGAEDDLQVMSPALLAAARLALADRAIGEAAGYMRQFQELTRDAAREFRESRLMEAVELCVEAGALGIAEELVEESEGGIPHHRCTLLSARAALLEAKGDAAAAAEGYAEAAKAWEAFGSTYQAELARESFARCRANP